MRSERVSDDGVAPEQKLLNRVVGQAIRVVRIGMAAGEPEDPLGQQVAEGVAHLARRAIIDQAPCEAVDQAVPALRSVQQDGAAIGACVRLVECRDEGFVEKVREENTLWYRVDAHRKRLRCRKSLSLNSFVRRGGVCVSTEIGPFVNYPG